MLFNNIIFGPIISRRFGRSLGINLLSTDKKQCTFDCIYCECGWTFSNCNNEKYIDKNIVIVALELELSQIKKDTCLIDSITFSGNGEPTLHPQFSEIVVDVIRLRDQYTPKAKVVVLSNATMLDDVKVFLSLKQVDDNVLKLDAGTESCFKLIDRCLDKNITLDSIVENLRRFQGEVTIQTMFLRGVYQGVFIDNTKEDEVVAWIQRIKKIRPRKLLLYPIDRDTPVKNLERISRQELERIAHQVRKEHIETLVYE